MIDIYNYRTQQYEACPDGHPTVERLPEFIPQHPSAQALYAVLCEQGVAPLEAATRVLQVCVDAHHTDET